MSRRSQTSCLAVRDDQESCYGGMVAAGLIDTRYSMRSLIADPANSPLSWINPNGPMPFDSAGPNPDRGRDDPRVGRRGRAESLAPARSAQLRVVEYCRR